MQQLLSVWFSLNPRRRIMVVVSTVAMFAAILGLSRIAANPGMALLYAGVEANAAGDVVESLEQRNVDYEVRGESIYVDSSRRDELRMTLAAEGLPANSTKGYELLDTLSGFGTTSQMFDAAYWRAKEGELARTILVSPNIRAARVHLSNSSSQPFRRDTSLSASVTVSSQGAGVDGAQARALRNLVASAVAGLTPENVSIIDARAGVIIGADDSLSGGSSSDDKALEMRRSVERIIEARVGVGKAIVEVSVETETDSESIFERTFDPDSRVAISTDTEERSTNSNESGSGSVTVASNLPAGDAEGGGDTSTSQNSEIRERTNYEVSEVKREILKVPGAIKRLSVAVLVDGLRTIEADGSENFQPRSDEEIASLRDLVASTVGFNESRGDTITIKSMAFEPLADVGTEATISTITSLGVNVMTVIQLVVLGLVAIILGLFVVRPILTSGTLEIASSAPQPVIAPPIPPMPSFDLSVPPALNGEIDDNSFSSPAMSTVTDFDLPDLGGLPSLPMASGFAGNSMNELDSDDPVARLREMIKERQEETVATLKSWMEDEETA
ncbi:flagellar basal-body MS-ring/collar protein FliF [Falsihalocynthiibacter sp. S25ZX9]|uniref:flagellar basal-body MS-ring/collar protein FliF n=1 Tax=unclassified Falsihalocynthiibacter TaxID=2854191 RepID=UPI00350EBE70